MSDAYCPYCSLGMFDNVKCVVMCMKMFSKVPIPFSGYPYDLTERIYMASKKYM